ncbi:MAG: hypothetical protein R3D29_16020 [Nitratireductor sp.]
MIAAIMALASIAIILRRMKPETGYSRQACRNGASVIVLIAYAQFPAGSRLCHFHALAGAYLAGAWARDRWKPALPAW